MGARLVLLNVVQPPPAIVSDLYAVSSGQTEDMIAAAEQFAEQRLRELAMPCIELGISTRVVRRLGAAVPEILARARDADFIVLGSHGHGAMYDLLVGSTAHGVLRRAPCPVVVVPAARR